ncbi:hypothetical protein CFP56_026561 [Quercus suber]|uniref:holo-[acyl-carrier-protein] synthase n=1 Tax=Quercus suber TaxID=58331 RepID=A0AAW0K082_QUESU
MDLLKNLSTVASAPAVSFSSLFNSARDLQPWQFEAKERETHLWYILPNEVKNANLLNQYLEILSPCEKENVFCMCGDQLQRRALLAHALVRTTIARCIFFDLNVAQSEWQPRLCFIKILSYIHVEWQDVDGSHLAPLHFNISHTSSIIACGVTVNSTVSFLNSTVLNPSSFKGETSTEHPTLKCL